MTFSFNKCQDLKITLSEAVKNTVVQMDVLGEMLTIEKNESFVTTKNVISQYHIFANLKRAIKGTLYIVKFDTDDCYKHSRHVVLEVNESYYNLNLLDEYINESSEEFTISRYSASLLALALVAKGVIVQENK